MVDTINHIIMTSTHPGDALHRLLHAYKHAMRDASRAAKIDLPATHMRMLKVVGHLTPCTAHDIAARLHRDKAQITRALQELDRAGLLQASPDPSDGRRRRLTLTATGTRMLERIAEAERAAGTRMLRGLSPAAIDQFVELADAMTDNLRHHEPHS